MIEHQPTIWQHVRRIDNSGLEKLPRPQLVSLALAREVAYVLADRSVERHEITDEDFWDIEKAWMETSQMLNDNESKIIETVADGIVESIN